jgi:endonuclease G
MGNPSGAAAEAKAADNYLLEKPYYALSYNNGKGTPNWVSWRLAAEDIGSAPRVDFYPDDELPADFEHVTPSDYTGSGFDRGHLCPHADRSATEGMSRATFAMSNIIPQSPNVNRQAWEELESYCRELAEQGEVLYIVAGPAGQGGEGREGRAKIIGRDHTVVVPAQCWKVILVLPAGSSEDPSKVDDRARLIAVIMPNDMSVGAEWTPYRVSVAEVEKLTGYSFFDRVPASVMGPRKQKADTTAIPTSGGGGGGE